MIMKDYSNAEKYQMEFDLMGITGDWTSSNAYCKNTLK